MNKSRQTANDWRLVSLLFVALAALILWPAFSAGVLFLRDMPWPDHLYLESFMHQGVTANLPLLSVLRLLNHIIPADILQKLVLLAVLSLSGIGMYYLQKRLNMLSTFYIFLAAVLYMLNPYVLDRLIAGHWLVLAGYAFLPFFVRLAYNAHAAPTRHTVTLAVGAWAIYPLVSIHWWYIVTLFLLPAVLYKAIKYRRHLQPASKVSHMRSLHTATRTIPWAYIAAPVLGIWLLFLLLRYLSLTSSIGHSDFVAFATQPIHVLGALGSVLTLRGFWQHAFSIIPGVFEALWVLVCGGLLALTYMGIKLLHTRHPLRARYAAWTFITAVVLAIGYASPLTQWLTDVLRAIVPGYSGLREPQKLVGILAFMYASLAPLAMQHIRANKPRHTALQYFGPIVIGGYALCMVGAVTAAHKSLIPYTYPNDWRAVNTTFYYAQPKQVLVLPWNGYVPLPFANNVVTANPAATYFSAPTNVRQNSGIRALDNANGLSALDRSILSLTRDTQALTAIRAQGYDYILLLHTQDYTRYKKQLDSSGIELIYSGQTLDVYRTSQQLLDQTF
jgi:hypothetical protein